MEERQVKVGVGVLIFDERGRVLLGLRKSKHGKGTWCPPGGHIEYGESIEAAAVREVSEETGLILAEKDLALAGVSSDLFESGKHYITVMMKADIYEGHPACLEADKCECWQWFAPSDFPQNLFLSLQNFLAKNPLV
ncbi:MAG: NUDIX domain-containing protein [Alphaproteobacteria bacterium]|nr:NUDIX domain-containing protein [Alphaproteobacteria bacterium]